jgi:signal transduction histidine kinase
MKATMNEALLERFLDLSRRMAETRTLNPLLEYAMNEAMSLVGAERGYIVLVNNEGALDFCVTRGQEADENAQDQISRSILSKVIQSAEPLIVRDASDDPTWNQSKSVAVLRLRSVMCVPLISRGETIGAIYVENRSVKGRFDEQDLAPLIFFANQAAVSIENAALNDDLEARVAARTRELEQAKAQLEHSWTESIEANRLRTVLLGNVAHDLRSPLTIVIESLSLMQSGAFGDMTEEQAEWIGKSLDAAMYVLNLTNDIFDLTKIEMGGLVLYPQVTPLNEFLKKIFNIAQGLPWPDSVAVRLDIEPDLPAVMLDPIRISQVLVNLFSNALKFTSQGSVTLHAQALPGQGQVLIGVADTGDGIPADQIDRLFQRFQQVDGNRERRRVGTGLGLAICRDLVEMHQGRIWVESQRGVGSDFKFVLPVNGTDDAQQS